LALADGVESANVVGYQDITVKPGFNCISLNFDAVGGGGINIQDLITTNNLIAGNSAGASDQIQVWDGSRFTVYFYRAYKATNPGRFTIGPCWVDGNNASVKATTSITNGVGVWFARPDTAPATATIKMMGEVGATAKNLQINPGFNMIGLAFPVDIEVNSDSCPIDWTTCAVAGNSAGASDQIQVWDGSRFNVYFYRAYKATNPGRFTIGPCWVDGNNASVKADLTLHAGEGFWYARPSDQEAGALVQESPIAVAP
jgi:uncharacterized protein YfaP (DUF2135 family)